MYSLTNRYESTAIPSLPDYAFGEKLGAGSYGTVYKARLISNIQSRPSSAACNRPTSARPTSALPTFYAIKCINRKVLTKTTEDLLINEIKTLKDIKHENIVEMYDFQWDENYIYIVTEYCAGGDMSTFIRSRQQLTETRARPFVQQIAKVLKFLYEKGISHMDLKPENILLTSIDKPILKVADFGVAQHIGEQGSRSVRGTLVYMAPEILSENPYDNRVDLWSIGVILYECLFGRPPFVFSTVNQLIDLIKSDIPIEIPNDAQISPECRNLLENLLQRNPDKRISFPDFFRHPFICLDVSPQIAHADNTLQQAINYEQSGDFKKALDYRVQALDEYLAIIKVDEDADRRRMLRMKVKQGVVVAEDLKKRIKEATTNSESTPSVTTTSLLPSPSTSPSDDLDLNNDKELFDAYQHCLNGNQLMNAFMFARACEEYEIGLDVMLRVARTETDPTKIKILRNMIIHYLNKAESCKQRCETQRLDLAIEKIKQDSENDTTIMNESTYEEKKQRSPLQQTCHLQ
ncbi:unnamed protein product [Rotaria sp. Silwood1]|nr:unnamed protein product [Rotaria sp. Silwood1]CAF3361035.1 unnamed protein product [Rotaria sp. Silwood1]CAF3384659.1 unnamed protein product [Rotaria sp. Silwood1]CAF3399700.1 unnamed protein product [Rotaria sp. Silwood1]CAF4612498.1 unnamed protein product [Rotaria sp. Silwood1]